MNGDKLYKAFQSAADVRTRAYTPYSEFKVGAALVDSQGHVYTGCNVENASYGATICAERSAVLSAIANGNASGFTDLVVVTDANPPAVPCALCLQVLAEFCAPELKVHLGDLSGIRKVYTLKELLPHPFNRASLTGKDEKTD
ncbi:MAG: cytidine deaminase [Spirochaetota bacterium]